MSKISAGLMRFAPRISIPVMRLSGNAKIPTQGTDGAAAFDLSAALYGQIEPGQTRMVDIDLSMAIPLNFVGLICSRSGLAAKNSVFVLNAPGVIDSDYRGPIKLIMLNAGTNRFTYDKGDRLAQMMFVRHEQVKFMEVQTLEETQRGFGGFGSTGLATA